MLADLDRPITTEPFEPWGRDVSLRPISAAQYVEVMGLLSGAGDDDTAAKVKTFALICSYGVADPTYKAEEWAADGKLGTLTALGNRVLELTNSAHTEAAKKN